jgi:SAM-dependent methyltransferase
MKENKVQDQCPVCEKKIITLGIQKGLLDKRNFEIKKCINCHYSFVKNYRIDYDVIYNEDYYRGLGADPAVDYIHEIYNLNSTIRNYEWRGIFEIYQKNYPKARARWLDFGCGAGGLVNYVNKKGVDIIGAEDGWASEKGRELGIPILRMNELDQFTGQFDFITAIEVFEHIPNPIDAFKKIRKLLKPGGVLFLTTGNAYPWRNNFLDWPYSQCPDVHVSFFEPHTLAFCLESSGFVANNNNSFVGFTNIIKFKVLKSLRFKNRNFLIDLLPWSFISRIVDYKYQVSMHPYGVAIAVE